MNLNFEHFWSKNKTTRHVLLSSVFVCMDAKNVFPSDNLREIGSGIYCKFDPRIARMDATMNVINIIQASVWQSIQDKDPIVRSVIEFNERARSGVRFP